MSSKGRPGPRGWRSRCRRASCRPLSDWDLWSQSRVGRKYVWVRAAGKAVRFRAAPRSSTSFSSISSEPPAMMATSAQQSAASTSVVKHYEHYFTPAEVDHLSSVQRGKQSIRQADATRLAACAFAECVGARLGLYVLRRPRVTTIVG